MPSRRTVGQKDVISIDVSLLEMPSQSGTRTRVRLEEIEHITQFDTHARWVEEDKKEDMKGP